MIITIRTRREEKKIKREEKEETIQTGRRTMTMTK
jgi:hypothetical protein